MNARTQVIVKAGSDVAGKFFVLGVLALAARVLPTGDFAELALASTLGWILAVITDFGQQVHLAKVVARAPAEAGRHVWPLVYRRAALFAAGLAVAAAASWLWKPPGTAPAFAAIAISFVASAFVEFLNYAYRGLRRTDLESLLNFSQRFATLALAALLLPRWPALSAVAVALVGPPFVAGAASLLVLRRLAPAGPATGAPHDSASIVRAVAPIGAGIVLSTLYFRIDVFLLARWSGPEAVAHYGAVFRMLDALRLFPAALLAVMTARMFQGRDFAFLRRLSVGLSVFGMVVGAALYVTAPVVVPLAFGAAFAPAVPYFRILAVAYPLLSLNYGLTTQLIGWDDQRAFAALTLAALLVNVALNAVLIPRLDASGAAWATVLTELGVTVLAVCALRRHARTPA